MKARAALCLAVALIVWLSLALVRVESQRYAMAVGMCWNDALRLPDLACVERAETRTAWYWHLLHALKG